MTTVTRDLVESVGDAINVNDIGAVMKHFADDATFDHAVGPEECGVRFEGKDTIRGVFAGLFVKVENIDWKTLTARFRATRPIANTATWLRTGTERCSNS